MEYWCIGILEYWNVKRWLYLRLFKRLVFVTSIVILFLTIGTTGEVIGSCSLDRYVQTYVEKFIVDHVFADSFSVEVDVPHLVKTDIYDCDSFDIQIDWNKGWDALRNKVFIPVRVMLNDEFFLMTSLTATIRLFDHVWIAKDILNRHHLITQKDVAKEMRDVTDFVWSPVKYSEELLGKRTKRVIGKGRIITVKMIEDQPLIRRGDKVKVTLIYRNLTVITTGFAKEDGWFGDLIRVRDPKIHSEIIGHVRSSRIVEVQL